MTLVRFYLHDQAGAVAQLDMACRLLQKAQRENSTAYVYAADAHGAKQLEEALWIFTPEAFVPHCLHPQDEALPASVRIGHVPPPQHTDQLLMNLSTEIPPDYDRFNRLFECISADKTQVQAGRRRYRVYREQGHKLEHHKIYGIRSPRLRELA